MTAMAPEAKLRAREVRLRAALDALVREVGGKMSEAQLAAFADGLDRLRELEAEIAAAEAGQYEGEEFLVDGLIRAAVRVFGGPAVTDAVRRETERQRGPDASETLIRQLRADAIQRADPTLTRWSAVMRVCDEECVDDSRDRKGVFDKVLKRDKQRIDRLAELEPEDALYDAAVEEESLRWVKAIGVAIAADLRRLKLFAARLPGCQN